MSQASEPRHVRLEELELLDVTASRDGGIVRYLEGGRYGLITSAYVAEIMPNNGPEPHAHPYAEFFIIHAGRGRYYIGDATFEALAGDVVIVPPQVVHHFVNAGSEPLQHTAVHEAPARRLLRRIQP
jgi:mannose-6-phosphate isomerase-like protein (cupin superfamily)